MSLIAVPLKSLGLWMLKFHFNLLVGLSCSLTYVSENILPLRGLNKD